MKSQTWADRPSSILFGLSELAVAIEHQFGVKVRTAQEGKDKLRFSPESSEGHVESLNTE